MIDERMIANAIKLCISQLPKIDDPIKYLYEVNQILNRFKTNLYKLMDERLSDIDPATLITISIRTGASIEAVGSVKVLGLSKTLLKIYGVRGYGRLKGMPAEFCESIDISDVFDARTICHVAPQYYLAINKTINRAREDFFINNHPDVLINRHSIFINGEGGLNSTYNLSAVISGIIYPEVLEQGREKISRSWDSGKATTKKSDEIRAIMSQAAKRRYAKEHATE